MTATRLQHAARVPRFPAPAVPGLGLRLAIASALAFALAEPTSSAFARARADVPDPSASQPGFVEAVVPILRAHCFECHDTKRHRGGIDLERFRDELDVKREPEQWAIIVDVVRDRSMPPPRRRAPSEDERRVLAEVVERVLADVEEIDEPGPALIQRLTHRQYDNSIRDLLGVDRRFSAGFPTDGGGGEGFDNNASTLFVPPVLMEKYLAAAALALELADPERYLVARPGPDLPASEAARRVVAAFVRRAWRGPVDPGDVERLAALHDRAAAGKPFEEAVKLPLRAALVSPRFLFLVERDRGLSEPYPVADHELAARLSYFLWSSTPDDELLRLADERRLADPEVLRAQTRRMLADPRADAFAEEFVTQWLALRDLERATEPDKNKFPEFNPELREAMIREPVAAFANLLRRGPRGSLLELLDSETLHVNEILARHYGIEGVEGLEFRPVPRPDADRGGLLGMAGVLTLTSYPQRTSPVLRGKWVLEQLLGTPPPPPPPDVGVLPNDDNPKDGLSFRQRLEAHRKRPDCAACHSRLDPLGFGLERFDPIGRVRTEIAGLPVDSAGELVTGETFDGPAELKAILLERKRDLFLNNVARRALSYGVRRGLEYYDAPVVRRILEASAAEGHSAESLVIAVVESYPFRHRRDSAAPANPAADAESAPDTENPTATTP